jgi:hypothetical protein
MIRRIEADSAKAKVHSEMYYPIGNIQTQNYIRRPPSRMRIGSCTLTCAITQEEFPDASR